MDERLSDQEIKPCPLCGHPTSCQKVLGGSVIYLSVADEYLKECLNESAVEFIIRDRLQRAERIIVDLRNRLKKYE